MPQDTDPFEAQWLTGTQAAAIGALRAAAIPIDLPRGGVVYAHGRPQKSIYGILTGQVRVIVSTNEMHPALGHIHGPGGWFGEVESILGIDSYVQMEADVKTRLCRISLRRFRAVAAGYPQLWEATTRLTAYNLWLATSAANDLLLRTPLFRIAAVLLRLSGRRAATQGSSPLNSIRASQQEIANLANVARSTASKILNGLQNDGVLCLDYGRVAILDTQKLAVMLET